MTSGTLPPSSEAAGRTVAPAPAAARAALALLRRLQAGTLTLRTPDGATHHATGASQPDLHARYAIDAAPITVVVDNEGVTRHAFIGAYAAPELWSALAELRATPS